LSWISIGALRPCSITRSPPFQPKRLISVRPTSAPVRSLTKPRPAYAGPQR
jgi:hypothetical protein